ncbi:hypothetical protein Pelo_11603 [Pelomyxa schiedti]|nr:hypothetical protein Pelo_11603 [Pelomyxa schiedti]
MPEKLTSAILSSLLWVGTLSGMELFSTTLSSTPALRILGGGLGSLLTFFALICLGTVKEIGWVDVIVITFVSAIIAATVHGVCFTTSILFSMVVVAYLWKVSSIAPKEPKSKRKH